VSDEAATYRISAFVLSWLPVLGISLEELAHAAELPHATLEAAHELTYDELVRFWQALERLSGDPVVGLHAGARFTLDQMGVMGPAVAASPSLDAALDVLLLLFRAFVRNVEIRRVDDDVSAGLEYTMPSLRTRHGLDNAFASILACVRDSLGRRDLSVFAVHHQMGPIAEREYEAFFGVVPVWHQPSSRILFRRADLALRMRGAEPELARLLTEHGPALLAADESSLAFERAFAAGFWKAHATGEATLENTAAAMETSARTLQRRLERQGKSFAELRAALLGRRATELLLDRSLSIDTIAERLGYASRTAFERAFVRWTGKTPHAIRGGE
jgi:AraC-like DNA-binding protein